MASCLSSCTKAALAGGVTLIGAMPNTHPSITNREALDLVQQVGVWNTSGCVLVCRGYSYSTWDRIYLLL